MATERVVSDEYRICIGCRRDFIWTAGEQQFYAERELLPPKRCPACRHAKRAARAYQEGRGSLWGWL